MSRKAMFRLVGGTVAFLRTPRIEEPNQLRSVTSRLVRLLRNADAPHHPPSTSWKSANSPPFKGKAVSTT